MPSCRAAESIGRTQRAQVWQLEQGRGALRCEAVPASGTCTGTRHSRGGAPFQHVWSLPAQHVAHQGARFAQESGSAVPSTDGVLGALEQARPTAGRLCKKECMETQSHTARNFPCRSLSHDDPRLRRLDVRENDSVGFLRLFGRCADPHQWEPALEPLASGAPRAHSTRAPFRSTRK